ncbi:MAG: rod-binding protein [Pseudomonadota bacterium]
MTDLAATAADYASLAVNRAPVPTATGDATKARKAAEDFEAFFLAQTFEQMFEGVEPDAMFGGGEGERVFRSLMFQEYGRQVAKSGGIGIADMVQREILRMQEVQKP